MWRAFNLDALSLAAFGGDEPTAKKFIRRGTVERSARQEEVVQSLESFLKPDGVLDGKKMQQDWFPLIKADVFISHSTQDQELALALAGWLEESMGLNAFVDSAVWGNAYRLLRGIDDALCWKPESETYSYELRNQSTGYVYMMLATALQMMIDSSECVFLINTRNSVTAKSVVASTRSPWIYSELATTRFVRRRTHRPGQLVEKALTKAEIEKRAMVMELPVNLTGMTTLRDADLIAWNDVNRLRTIRARLGHRTNQSHALDVLYDLHPEVKSV